MTRFMAFFAMLLSLSGCVVQAPPPQIRVVTQIHVAATQDGHTVHETYVDPAAMSAVLNYLRILDPYTTAHIEADTFRTDVYEITVEYSDGQRTVYRQLHDEYLQTDGGPWKKIDPAKGSQLDGIIAPVFSSYSDACIYAATVI